MRKKENLLVVVSHFLPLEKFSEFFEMKKKSAPLLNTARNVARVRTGNFQLN